MIIKLINDKKKTKTLLHALSISFEGKLSHRFATVEVMSGYVNVMWKVRQMDIVADKIFLMFCFIA